MRLVVPTALLALVAASFAAAQTAPPAPPDGAYSIMDGPRSGLTVLVHEGNGHLIDISSSLRAVGADDDCDQPHLHGTIAGKDEPLAPCGWGRLVAKSRETPLMYQTATAISEEERAVAGLLRHPPSAHWSLVFYGQLHLE